MARAVLALQPTVRTGLNVTYTAATVDGHGFDNANQDVLLIVKNASGVETTVTIPTPGSVDGLAIPDRTVAVPAAGEKIIGPFPKAVYNQDDSGGATALEEAVFVNAAPQASVTYAAVKMGSLAY